MVGLTLLLARCAPNIGPEFAPARSCGSVGDHPWPIALWLPMEGTGGFRSCRAALQAQRSTLSITSVCAGEEKGPFPHVAGELGRSLEFGAGIGQSAGPKQKVAPCRRQWRIIAQGG